MSAPEEAIAASERVRSLAVLPLSPRCPGVVLVAPADRSGGGGPAHSARRPASCAVYDSGAQRRRNGETIGALVNIVAGLPVTTTGYRGCQEWAGVAAASGVGTSRAGYGHGWVRPPRARRPRRQLCVGGGQGTQRPATGARSARKRGSVHEAGSREWGCM